MSSLDTRTSLLRAILVGGLAVSVLDGIDAIAAFGLVLGMGPIAIYQYVASGMLGPAAFTGGIATALLGLAVHVSVAFSAAAFFSVAATKLPLLTRSYAYGAAFGVGVFVVMNYLVIPFSQTPPSPFSLPLFLNGVIGHALFVGLPIAYAARRYLGSSESAPRALTAA